MWKFDEQSKNITSLKTSCKERPTPHILIYYQSMHLQQEQDLGFAYLGRKDFAT